jgi:hypothetical protein
MLKNYISIMRGAALAAMILCGASAIAQTTASGVINGVLVNKDGISIVFNTDPAGVTLGAGGTAAASLNFGTISAVRLRPVLRGHPYWPPRLRYAQFLTYR